VEGYATGVWGDESAALAASDAAVRAAAAASVSNAASAAAAAEAAEAEAASARAAAVVDAQVALRAASEAVAAAATFEGRGVGLGAATSPDIELGVKVYDGDCVGVVTMVDRAGPGPATYDVKWTGRADGRRGQSFDEAGIRGLLVQPVKPTADGTVGGAGATAADPVPGPIATMLLRAGSGSGPGGRAPEQAAEASFLRQRPDMTAALLASSGTTGPFLKAMVGAAGGPAASGGAAEPAPQTDVSSVLAGNDYCPPAYTIGMVARARGNWFNGLEGIANAFSSWMAGLDAADRSRAAGCFPLSFVEHAAEPLSRATPLASEHIWLAAGDSP
jgi:hypothetical protein